MNLEQIIEQVKTEYIKRMTQGDGNLLCQVEKYIATLTGKMLRPRMTVLSSATLGESFPSSRRTILLATCVEMLHNASLLHDDVIDVAERRRGELSVNKKWSNSVAILVGDYHFAKIMELLDEIGDAEVSRMINNTVKKMVEAELLQQEILSGREITEEDYLSIIDGKTANLFATAAALGNPAYWEFGLKYGRLFQIYDDIRDNEAPEFIETIIEQNRLDIPMGFEKLPKIEHIIQ